MREVDGGSNTGPSGRLFKSQMKNNNKKSVQSSPSWTEREKRHEPAMADEPNICSDTVSVVWKAPGAPESALDVRS